jgi:hypothetical protein
VHLTPGLLPLIPPMRQTRLLPHCLSLVDHHRQAPSFLLSHLAQLHTLCPVPPAQSP